MKEWVRQLIEGCQPYAVTSSRDLYDAPPVEYLIEGILPLYSVAGMTGYPGTGKTWLSMEMMRAVVTGTEFLGKFPVKKAPVLFVGNDASLLDYARQWRRLTFEEYSGNRLAVEEGLRDSNPFDTLVHFLIQTEFNLDDMDQIGRLIRTSQEVLGDVEYREVQTSEGITVEESTRQHFGLIVLDTLSKLTKSSEIDNTARDVVFENIRTIAESTGATVLVLHHNALPSEFRTGEEWRGGGAQFASLDCHFHLTARSKGLIEFKVKKFRGITPDPFLFNLDVHEEGPASLDYNSKPETKEDGENEIIGEMVEVLKNRQNAPTTHTDFATTLLAKHSDDFDDLKRFKRYISNILSVYVRKPDARIVPAVTSRGGRATLYKLSHIETQVKEAKDDAGSSPSSDSDGA